MKKFIRICFICLVMVLILSNQSLSQAGQLDKTFGNNGIVSTSVDKQSMAFSVAIQKDGKIIAAGKSWNGHNNDFALVRYNSDGTLDNSFGINAKVILPVGLDEDIANSVALQSNGKIVVGGYFYLNDGLTPLFALTRLNSNGTLDNTFGTNGFATTKIVESSKSFSIAIQNDDKIIATGYYFETGGVGEGFALVRYNSDGTLDNNFGTNGIVITQISNDYDEAQSVAIQTDGKIIVGGFSGYFFVGSYDTDFVLARYNSNGTLDNTFGIKGIVVFDISDRDFLNSIAVQKDGKILAAGNYRNGDHVDFAIFKFNSNGTLDNTFGANGFVLTHIGSDDAYCTSVIVQNDGKILACGNSRNGNDYDFNVVRYNSDGTSDNTFGTNGTVTTQVGNSDDLVGAAAIQSDGKIILAGQTFNGKNYDFAVVRYVGDATTSIIGEKGDKNAKLFTLDQNYPNPFNPVTTIRFSIPQKSYVLLKVFDMLGDEISTLTDEEKEAGSYEVEFNASLLTSGIYFYKLQTGSYNEVKKMILVK